MEVTVSLEDLSKLTKKLPSLIEELCGEGGLGYTEVESASGDPILLFALYKNKKIAVLRAYASAGAEMPQHSHEGAETIIVYEGCLDLILDGDTVHRLHPGDVYMIPPNVMHSAKWVKNSWVVYTTIPAAEGFPNARTNS
jgi:quercetin dioxygenase-like cupin family protein